MGVDLAGLERGLLESRRRLALLVRLLLGRRRPRVAAQPGAARHGRHGQEGLGEPPGDRQRAL